MLVDILLGHYMLTRGGDRRAVEISDLFTFEFKEEWPPRCMPLIFTTRVGKQNQHGRLETIGALRNKKPLTCMLSWLLSTCSTVGTLAMSLSQISASNHCGMGYG